MSENETPQSTLASKTVTGLQELPTVIERAANIPTMYINAVGLAMGTLDVRLFVGEMLPSPDGKSAIQTQRICLILTPEYLKVLAKALTEATKAYEAQFGQLRDVSRPPESKT
jgi:hypothetical protein